LVKYYIKKYIGISFIAAIAIFLAWITGVLLQHGSLHHTIIVQSLFYGGTVGVYLTYLLFKKYNLWTLYNNLRINRIILIVLPFIAYQVVTQLFMYVILIYTL